MNPALIFEIHAYTTIGVCFMLAVCAFASALGWSLIATHYIDGVARQPELNTMLFTRAMIFGGLMEAFPFLVLGVSMWFIFANPFMPSL